MHATKPVSKVRALPRVTVAQWQARSQRDHRTDTPLVIERAVADSVSTRRWSPEFFASKFGDHAVAAAMDLPARGIPYNAYCNDHMEAMPLREFIARLGTQACYLNQVPIDEFAGLRDDLDLSPLTGTRVYGMNVWMGSNTRSGLHQDYADNFLIQILGKKRAILIAPEQRANLYTFPEVPSKSSVNPYAPSATIWPRFARAERWEGAIEAGDALFIPHGWWHAIASEGVAISVNAWHGRTLSPYALFAKTGPATWLRFLSDFVWLGVLRRPYQQRLFSPMPIGLAAYTYLFDHEPRTQLFFKGTPRPRRRRA